MTDPISAYFDAINTEDWDTLAGLWEPDAALYPAGRARPRTDQECARISSLSLS